MNFSKLNNLVGWIVFLIATAVYFLTLEPTASWWDCGEYIATAYKLQVGHPPGAPLFQMIGRFFTLFAFGDETRVALMINVMSALSSSLTILFLFWTITMLARKILMAGEAAQNKGNQFAVLGAGLVGALAYTFSDSFWFSAVEGEVYAMSSFFTAVTFWAILKWERVADEPHNYRWLLFIAYLIGLSIGVHMLNLLAIPAIVYVFYFKKYKPNLKGFVIAGLVSLFILAFVMSVIIPLIVQLAGNFELFFVNSIGLPFTSGTIIYFLLLVGLIAYGLYYSRKKGKVVLNTAILAFMFILIGYSSFFMLVIRANANTPINENNPNDAITMLAYLNREQYGTWPLIHGPYYNAPEVDREDGKPIYIKDEAKGKYIITDYRHNVIPDVVKPKNQPYSNVSAGGRKRGHSYSGDQT
jgi:MFS family permease